MKKLLLPLAILPFMISCQNTEKKNLDKNALELENFNFETNRSTILSEKDSIEGDPGYYKLKSETILETFILTVLILLQHLTEK